MNYFLKMHCLQWVLNKGWFLSTSKTFAKEISSFSCFFFCYSDYPIQRIIRKKRNPCFINMSRNILFLFLWYSKALFFFFTYLLRIKNGFVFCPHFYIVVSRMVSFSGMYLDAFSLNIYVLRGLFLDLWYSVFLIFGILSQRESMRYGIF